MKYIDIDIDIDYERCCACKTLCFTKEKIV